MNTISFMTANYVARQLNYTMTEGWMQGDRATNAYFAPIETFAARFGDLLAEIQGLGFETLDLWLAHLNYSWATPEHLMIARSLLRDYGFSVASLAGWFGDTRAEFDAACRLAVGVHATLLGGNTALLQQDRASMAAILREYGLTFGIENHPEKTPRELLAKIGDGAGGVIGACVDTGWFGTHGYNASHAIQELSDDLVYVHLKDVTAPGAHASCRFGQGCVPVRACVTALKQIGYIGAISVEHEPDHGSPNQDVVASAYMLRSWLAEEEESERADGAR